MSNSFSLSPGVDWSEDDQSYYVTNKVTVNGGLAGTFQWGAVDAPFQVTGGEGGLLNAVYKPNDETYLSYFVAADYLSYSNTMVIVRQTGPLARNAVPTGQTPVLVKNDDEAEQANLPGIDFYARYPGALGSGLIVDICDAAGYADWEFKSKFQYVPGANEFHIAVVDGSGRFSGIGGAEQVETLTLNGSVDGGTPEKADLTVNVTGTVVAGLPEIVQVSLSGVTASTSVTVLGVAVAVNPGEDASIVAGKVETALKADANFASVIRVGATLAVTYAKNLDQAPTPNGSENGITKTYTVVQQGTNKSVITLGTTSVTITDGATKAATLDAIVAALSADKTNVTALTFDSATGIVSVTRKPAAAATPIAPYNKGNLVVEVAVKQVANSATPLTLYGVTVPLVNGDTIKVAAAKIAAALRTSADFGTATAAGSIVTYTRKGNGKKAKLAGFSSFGLTGEVAVRTTGRLGNAIEKYELMNATKGSKHGDGSLAYFADAINRGSQYIRVGDSSISLSDRTVTLAGGADDNVGVDLSSGYKMLANAELYTVDSMIGFGSINVQRAVLDAAGTRRDAVGYVSPPLAAVLNNKGREVQSILEWRNEDLNPETTYGFMDCNWALVYDKYNDVNRWIPCCGGTAGLDARKTITGEPWFSPAGYTYGVYKNYIKLAWSPSKDERDLLFPAQVNPIFNDRGNGIVLFGDSTATARPSAFNAVNVRRLFIFLEKNIATSSKRYVFGINDAFTRKQFVNAVTPLLRNVMSRRGIIDFRLVCDESNNPPDAVDRKEFNAAFYIKPTLAIRNIYLNFIGVSQTFNFEEIESA